MIKLLESALVEIYSWNKKGSDTWLIVTKDTITLFVCRALKPESIDLLKFSMNSIFGKERKIAIKSIDSLQIELHVE